MVSAYLIANSVLAVDRTSRSGNGMVISGNLSQMTGRLNTNQPMAKNYTDIHITIRIIVLFSVGHVKMTWQKLYQIITNESLSININKAVIWPCTCVIPM